MNALDRLFAKYLPDIDPNNPDPNPCWRWHASPYRPKPYATTHKTRGHVVVRNPSPQTHIRFQGKLQQPNRLLYGFFLRPLLPSERLHTNCGCVNPWHQIVTTTQTTPAKYNVPPHGPLSEFIANVIQPDDNFDFETFWEVWGEDLKHIPIEVINNAISLYQSVQTFQDR